MTMESVTNGPIPTMSIILIDVPCNKLISLFMCSSGLGSELGDPGDQLVKVLGGRIDIRRDPYTHRFFPNDAGGVDTVVVEQIIIELSRGLSLDPNQADRTAEFLFHGGGQ